jgi:hypothetical protein
MQIGLGFHSIDVSCVAQNGRCYVFSQQFFPWSGCSQSRVKARMCTRVRVLTGGDGCMWGDIQCTSYMPPRLSAGAPPPQGIGIVAHIATEQANASTPMAGISPHKLAKRKASTDVVSGYSIDWNNAAKAAVVGGLKLVPYVGSGLSTLTGIFWPDSEVDIWGLVKDQVRPVQH